MRLPMANQGVLVYHPKKIGKVDNYTCPFRAGQKEAVKHVGVARQRHHHLKLEQEQTRPMAEL